MLAIHFMRLHIYSACRKIGLLWWNFFVFAFLIRLAEVVITHFAHIFSYIAIFWAFVLQSWRRLATFSNLFHALEGVSRFKPRRNWPTNTDAISCWTNATSVRYRNRQSRKRDRQRNGETNKQTNNYSEKHRTLSPHTSHRCMQCCSPRGKSLFSRTNLQVLVLVLGPQVLVLGPQSDKVLENFQGLHILQTVRYVWSCEVHKFYYRHRAVHERTVA